eukprot:9223562-Lingulodinium_polyedra.AAC.1
MVEARERAAEEAKKQSQKPMVLSVCQLSLADMQRWQTLFEQVKPRSQAAENRRARALDAPLQVGEAELRRLDSMP